jgi:hypothetical protein
MIRASVRRHEWSRRVWWWVRMLLRSQHHAAHHHAGLPMIHRLVRSSDAADNSVGCGVFVRVVLAVRALAIQPAMEAALEAFAVPLPMEKRRKNRWDQKRATKKFGIGFVRGHVLLVRRSHFRTLRHLDRRHLQFRRLSRRDDAVGLSTAPPPADAATAAAAAAVCASITDA